MPNENTISIIRGMIQEQQKEPCSLSDIKAFIHKKQKDSSREDASPGQSPPREPFWEDILKFLGIDKLIEKIINYSRQKNLQNNPPENPFCIPKSEDYSPLGNAEQDVLAFLDTAVNSRNLKEMFQLLEKHRSVDEVNYCLRRLQYYSNGMQTNRQYMQQDSVRKTPDSLLLYCFNDTFVREFIPLIDKIIKFTDVIPDCAQIVKLINAYLKELHCYTYNALQCGVKIPPQAQEYFRMEEYPTGNQKDNGKVKEILRLPYVIEFYNIYGQLRPFVISGKTVILKFYL